MAHVPGLKHDIFISYAHADSSEWVNAFRAGLAARLQQRWGIRADFWQDTQKIRIGHQWAQEIEEGINNCAAFVALVSPSYRDSAWCSRERRLFLSGFPSPQDSLVEDISRLMKVIKTPYPDGGHRELLAALQDYPFFKTAPPPDDLIEFVPESADFRTGIERVAHALACLLEAMYNQRQTVFVATAAADVEDMGQAVKNELAARGFGIRPRGALDNTYNAAYVRRQIEPCVLCVHVIGSEYDRFAEDQIQAALDEGKKLVFYLAPATAGKAMEARQQALRERIEQGRDLPRDITVLKNPSARGMIEAVLGLLKPAATSEQAAPPGSTPNVYLLFDPTDQEDSTLAAGIEAQLRASVRMEVFRPTPGLAPADHAERHRKMLFDADGVLLLSKAPDSWFWYTVPELVVDSNPKPPRLRSKAVYLSDPAPVALPNITMISSPAPTIQALEPFLAPIRPTGVSAYAGR